MKTTRLCSIAVGTLTLATANVLVPAPLPAPAAPTVPSGQTADGALEVVVDGLDHPRGMVLGPSGSLLVAEAGREGQQPCLVPSPGTGDQPACFSPTGVVTVAAPGWQSELFADLPTLGDPGGAATSGPHDIEVTGEGLLVLYGFAHNPEQRALLGPPGEHLGRLVLFEWDGDSRPIADLARHELQHNPGGEPGLYGVFTNPFALLRDGRRYLVVDSGANTVLGVSLDGRVSTVAVAPPREVTDPFTGEVIPMESVPTGIARGADGDVYVGELTGYPFPVGAARILRLVPGRAQPEVVASGFTNVIDIAFDQQGRLLVLEIATNGMLSGDPSGALKRIEPDGSVTTLLTDGLVSPARLAVAGDGSIYMANHGTSVGGGEVVRFVPSDELSAQ